MSDSKGYTSRGLLTIVAGITGIVPFIADWNETHIHNPNWPGHARFHNGQTMSMGVCLGLCTLWKTWWDNTDNLLTASVFASMYYVTQFSAWYYPGSTAYDPPQEFPVSFPHFFVVGPNLAMVGVAYWLEQRRVQALGEKGRKRA